MRGITAFGLVAVGAQATETGPIRKVLELLTNLQTEINDEHATQKSQFEAYSDWCLDQRDEKEDAIQWGERQLEDAQARKEQFSADVAANDAKIQDIAAAIAQDEGSVNESQELCKKEHEDFLAEERELNEAIDQLVRAGALLKRAGLGLPQMKEAMAQIAVGVQTVLQGAAIHSDNAKKLNALLEETESDDDDGPTGAPSVAAYESHSGAIMDLLAKLKVDAEKEMADTRRAEQNRHHNCAMTQQGLTDSIEAANNDLTEQKTQKGSNGDGLGKAQSDEASTSKTLGEDKKYLAELNNMCAEKADEWEALQTCNREQLNVLKVGIDTLSGDDFTKASASRQLIQLSSKDDVRQEIARVLKKWADKTHSTGLAQLAVRTRVGDDPFGKVRQLIGDMINRLEKQGAKEASKNAYCNSEKKETTATRNKLSARQDQLQTRIDGAKADIASLKEDTAEIAGEIASIQKAMAEATALRQKEASSYAKNKADIQLSEQQISSAIEALQAEFSNSGAALVQQPNFGSEIFSGKCVKKVDGASGIIGILETTLADFARANAEAETTENAAQRTYSAFKQESDVNLAGKTSEKKGKEAQTASTEAALSEVQQDAESNSAELDAVLSTLEKLRKACEHKPQTFAERAAKRQEEIEGLREALNILETETAGAFLQKRTISQHI